MQKEADYEYNMMNIASLPDSISLVRGFGVLGLTIFTSFIFDLIDIGHFLNLL